MSVAACAELVQRGDPDRFRAVMAAPRDARAQLFPLYAFNLEVARAPWVTQEPLIAEMRLQWWRDVVENAASGAARAHEVAGPLHEVIQDFGLPVEVLDKVIAARRWDIHRDPHEGAGALDAYLDETGAGLSVSTVTSSERATTAPSTTRNTRRVSSIVGHWALTA
ncbi:MAG: squalene/phytoene synthase family protein, partial [Rhodobacterales bacterium]|nr:squalene/phytoene synthase family protein [Rhodobacterales bacterium]